VMERRAQAPEGELRRRIAAQPPPLDLCAALRGPGVAVVAEIKRASPSKGALNERLDPGALAARYATAGADAISVLTEPTRFHGSLDDLTAARAGLRAAGCDRPLLRKDFVVDPYQLLEARAWGADAALLIVAALEDGALAALLGEALALGLTPLVEVHNADELARALALRPPLIGINNRDLRTFAVDLGVTRALRPLVPADTLALAESGIRTPEDMRALAALGVDGALIGEALVTADDPAAALRAFKAARR